MKTIAFNCVELQEGYLYSKDNLNRDVTIHAVYDRFEETGRIKAFACDWVEGQEQKPHIYWDSDVAKWMEGAAYILKKHPSAVLEERIDAIVENIRKNQQADGYFNVYYIVCKPEERFTDRTCHELYCAGHLIEAAIAYHEATGKDTLLGCIERYVDHIIKVFVQEKSASFRTPGHEEIELALVRLYRHTGKKKYLDLSAYFINERGRTNEDGRDLVSTQSHLPVREQTEALGHAVRALYLYTAMAYLAKETQEEALLNACRTLWEDIDRHKMYITGGVGSTHLGESFTMPYDLPNDTAYAETCAAIAMMFFGNAMLALENDARYADTVERAFYNGVLSGLSLKGDSFFYTNPLEINRNEYFQNSYGSRRFPINQRVNCFTCSCCPPNLNRLLASLGNYLYGVEDGVLYVNQYAASSVEDEGIRASVATAYPNDGVIHLTVTGARAVALRIPRWCEEFTLNRPYTVKNGYAYVEDTAGEILLTLRMPVRLVYAHTSALRDAGKAAIMRGPIVYCAEGVDNVEELHRIAIPTEPSVQEFLSPETGLVHLELSAKCDLPPRDGSLYSCKAPQKEEIHLRLLPYSAFANRGRTNMRVWFRVE